MMRVPFAFFLLLASSLASADAIYKCTDEHGGILISNTKVDKSCKTVVSGPDSSLPPPKAKPSSPGPTANPTPAGFPRVAEDTQKARDSDRRRILEQELASEQKGLEAARKDLAEQEALRPGPDRLVPYKERVAQHERNLQAINKELANLK